MGVDMQIVSMQDNARMTREVPAMGMNATLRRGTRGKCGSPALRACALAMAVILPAQALANDCEIMRNAAVSGMTRDISNIQQMRDGLLSNTSLYRQCVQEVNKSMGRMTAQIGGMSSGSTIIMQIMQPAIDKIVQESCEKTGGRIDDARNRINREIDDAIRQVQQNPVGQVATDVITQIDQAQGNKPVTNFGAVWDRIAKSLFGG